MTVKTIAAAFVISCLPAISFAMGCSFGTHQAQSCAEGAIWDAQTQTCVKQVTS